MFTVITTYYEEPELLVKFINTHANADYSVIVVDDGSTNMPAINIFNSMQYGSIQLFRVVEDLGFNSHGCRNLAMQQSKTEWNVLVDIDYEIKSIDKIFFDQLDKNTLYAFPVTGNNVSRLSINDFVVTKDLFWKAGGYDTEFIGMHHGDRLLIERMTKGKKEGQLLQQGVWLKELRSQTVHIRTVESNDKFEYMIKHPYTIVCSTTHRQHVTFMNQKVKQQRAAGIWCDPTPFKWERQI